MRRLVTGQRYGNLRRGFRLPPVFTGGDPASPQRARPAQGPSTTPGPCGLSWLFGRSRTLGPGVQVRDLPSPLADVERSELRAPGVSVWGRAGRGGKHASRQICFPGRCVFRGRDTEARNRAAVAAARFGWGTGEGTRGGGCRRGWRPAFPLGMAKAPGGHVAGRPRRPVEIFGRSPKPEPWLNRLVATAFPVCAEQRLSRTARKALTGDRRWDLTWRSGLIPTRSCGETHGEGLRPECVAGTA
jgi:hypothetical protein